MKRVFTLLVVGACVRHPSAAIDTPSDGSRTPDAGGDVTHAAYLVHEKFDAMTAGEAPSGPWSIETTAGAAVTVREVSFASNKSVEITKPAVTGLASLSTTFVEPQGGRIAVEATVLARETSGFKAIPYIYDGEGRAVASVSFQDGNVAARVGATTTIVQPFRADVWYRVRVVVDTTTGTFDLFVDGVRKHHDQLLRTSAAAIDKVRYYIDGASASTLLVDNVRIYNEAAYIGVAPEPVFDVRNFGAIGDGVTNDTVAIQAAIDAAAGTGGSVRLAQGSFLSGTLTLRGKTTFFIEPSAVLLGTTNAAQYPEIIPNTGNTQLNNCKRALLYATEVEDITIDGGGTIDGQGDAFSGAEGARPMLIWAVKAQRFNVRNLYLKKGAVWSLVSMESDHVHIDNINVQSDNITHDGIDIVDGTDITVENATVRSGDDAMCLKSGVRRGIDTMTVRDSMFSGSNGGSNGIKFGTATYGAFKNITIEDSYVKDVQYAAMAVESRQGSDVDHITFRRIGFDGVGSAFFVYLAQQSRTHPVGDTPKLGSMNDVSFTDIAGTTTSWPRSPHQGSLITGHIFEGTTYPITNLAFTNVTVAFEGGRTTVPATPPEAIPDQYPESNMFGDLLAWGYYLRHVQGVSFTNCASRVIHTDVRAALVTEDVGGLVGSP
jgi:hypothetical protein